MPKILDRMVSQLRAKGYDKKSAYAIATSSLQKSGNLKKGSNKATAKGKKRGAMTPAARAKDRAAKKSGGKPSDYKYKASNNTAVKNMAEGGEVRDPTSHRTPGQIKRQVRGYNARPEIVKKRSNNNKARRKLGLKKGDPRDAHHVKPQREGGSNKKSNLKAVHRSKNRAWRAEKSSKTYRSPSARKKSTPRRR